MDITQLSRPITIDQAPLPMQVCYIVPIDAPGALVDAIFKDCYQRWGGRDTLIIPINNGVIDEKYWTWARALDPDVVYSYIDLDNALLDRIDRDMMPSAVEIHRSHDGRFEPNFREAPEPLHALSLLPYLANNRGWGPPRPLALLTKYLAGTVDPFVADSFGISDFGPGMAQAEDVLRYANTLALGDRAANPHQSVATEDIANTLALLPRLTSFASETLTMAEISGIGYDAHRQALEPAWDTYNIIVGDSTIDRVVFWNARVGAEPWLRKQIIALRVPEAHLEDSAFHAALIDYVARTAYSRHGGAPKRIVLRSSSVTEDRLRPLIEPFLFRSVHAQIELFTDPADCAATKVSNWAPGRNVESGRYTESPLALPAVRPPHLAVWPVLRPMLTAGAWAVRATFSRDAQDDTGDGRLAFPRRWQSVFDLRADVLAKPARSGSLRLLVTNDTKPVHILLPLRDDRFVRSLLFGYHFRTTTEPRVVLHRESPRLQVVTSSAGRQLIRLLSKLDDLGEAFALIENPFWRAVFAELAGPLHGASDDDLSRHADKLRKRFKGKTNFSTDDDLMMMAAEFVRLAPDVRLPRPRRPFAWFVDLYRKHRDDSDAIGTTPEPDADLRAHVSAKLTALCSRGIFYQGYTWSCANCNNVNFLPVTDLAPLMPCAVCKTEHALAADFESRFHLDETIVRGMREEGLRAVVFALGVLRASADHAFLLAPPLDVNIEGMRPTDLDIVCVVDGRLVIGEAKDSRRHFTQAKSDDVIAAARILRPDAIVLACPDPKAIARVNKQVSYIKTKLADPRIEVRAITANIRQDGAPTSLIARYFWKGGITVVKAPPPDPPA